MKTKNHVVFGLATAGLIIILFLVMHFTNIPLSHPAAKWTPILIIIGMVIFSIFRYSKINTEASFGDRFGNGFRTTAVAVIIFIIFFIIFVQLFPGYKEKFILEALAAGPNAASTANYEEDIKLLRENFLVSVLAGNLFSFLIPGMLASLLGAALTNKK